MDFGSLPLSLVHRVDRACDEFEAAWRAGRRPRIEDYLGEAAGSERLTLLHALLASELELRRKLGERPTSEDYLGRFPAHAGLVRSVLAETVEAGSPRPPAPAAMDEPALANYKILGELGRGGMGVVYRALDRRRDQVVALKTVQRAAPAAILRFKQEFRTLADVSHPNLVALYELASDGRSWFFTMELVDGVDFLTYVRPPANMPDEGTAHDPESSSSRSPESDIADTRIAAGLTGPRLGSDRAEMLTDDPARGPGLSPSRLDRLRTSIRQLAEGVATLHEAGKLHRDIKPSNVLVTRRGRVVLLDFGLAVELDQSGLHQSSEPHILGTVAYMAPEQAAGRPVSQAGDWYSVGVMLYEALTGRPPFLGRPLEVLMDKQRSEPPAPRQWVPDVPEDLDALCIDLLRRHPVERPSGRDVLFRLGSMTARPGTHASPQSSPTQAVSLIGRQRHLEALTAAFAAVQQGRTVVLYVHGGSGVGKSALVQHFLDGLAERDEAVVLAGRCYEREAVPYKAIDGLIDALVRHLRHLPHAESQGLLPRDIGPLLRVFPVLRHVEAVALAPRRPAETPDPQEVRRRAFAALRELLARLGDRRPLVLSIDDLQWGDVDSATLLSELLRPPDPPVLLLLGCYRSEDAATSPLLRELLGLHKEPDSALDRRELAIEALTGSEAEALASTLLDRGDPAAKAHTGAIARESGGNPFFITELVRHLQPNAEPLQHPLTATGISLDEMLWARILRFPAAARQLLEVVAVSGQPLSLDEACRAAGLGVDEHAAPALLHAGRLIRSTGAEGGNEVETYHDRVRETVVAHLSPSALEDHHRYLARTLEVSDRADFEALAVHYRGAGEPARAGELFARAAEQAAEALAFDRAVTLYRRVLELRSPGEGEDRCLRTQLANALANAGRGAEAAREYLATATGAGRAEGLRLKQCAGYQLLISGHVNEGLGILDAVLESMGSRLPDSPRQALVSLLVSRAILRVRGLGFRERDSNQIPPEVLDRVDIARGIAVGLSVVDWIRGASFQSRSLLLALRAGEPLRVALALAWEAVISACQGWSARRRTARLIAAAKALAQRLDHPHALGMATLAKGAAEFLEGRFLAGVEFTDRAAVILREHGTGVTWELDRAQIFGILSLFYAGRVSELRRRSPRMVQEARERGNLYQESTIEAGMAFLPRLAADQVDEARVRAAEAIRYWSQQGFHFQHLTYFFTCTYIDLYVGDATGAWGRVGRIDPQLRASQLLRIQFVRIDVLEHSGRAAVAAAAAARDPRPLLRTAAGYARRLDRERLPWARALALLIRAGVASVRGDATSAVTLLTGAAAAFDAVDMGLFAASARRRLGVLLGGEEGGALMAQADAWMTGQEIRNPARMAACVAPGFQDR